jgi:hypothetical protein
VRELIFLRDDVDVADVGAATQSLGYVPEKFIDKSADDPFELHFLHPQQVGTLIGYVENSLLGVNYLVIIGPQATSVRHALEKLLPHCSSEDAYERAASDPDLEERMTALFHVALLRGPVPEPRELHLLAELFHHANAKARHAAVLATAFFEWPAIEPALEELICRETDPQNLHDAKVVYSRLQTSDNYSITNYRRLFIERESQKETIWVRQWSDGRDGFNRRYVVSSIPTVVDGLSLEDVVDAEWRDEQLVMTRLHAKSGHRTLRADAGPHELETNLREHRVRLEAQTSGRVAIDVPPDSDLEAISNALDRLGVAWQRAD